MTLPIHVVRICKHTILWTNHTYSI